MEPSKFAELLKKLFRKNGPVFDTSNFRKAFQTAACAVALGRKVGPEDWQYEGLLPYDLRRSAGLLFAI